jgi:hypothetical protein
VQIMAASWVFVDRIRFAGLTLGDGFDNTAVESFWGNTQIELLNRWEWKTRVNLANATFIPIAESTEQRPRSTPVRKITAMLCAELLGSIVKTFGPKGLCITP